MVMARTYQDAVAFTDKLLALRKRSALSFTLGRLAVTAVPVAAPLERDELDLDFSGDDLQVTEWIVTVEGVPSVTMYISAGPWGYDLPAATSHFLFVHDSRRRKAQQVDVLGPLDSDRSELWSTPRFSFMGSRVHRLRLLDWLEQDHVERDGSSLLLGNVGEPERIVINLLKIGLLKQHVRGHQVIGALVQDLPPRLNLDEVAAAKQGNGV